VKISKKEDRQGWGPLAATEKHTTTVDTSLLYHMSPPRAKDHFESLYLQAQRFAACARDNWRGAIRVQDAIATRRFFTLAMKHHAIADHLAGLLADWSG